MEYLDDKRRKLWLKFVRTHRQNFTPSGRFVICSAHFSEDCFERRYVRQTRGHRHLREDANPTIWTPKLTRSPESKRSRRRISIYMTLLIGKSSLGIKFYAQVARNIFPLPWIQHKKLHESIYFRRFLSHGFLLQSLQKYHTKITIIIICSVSYKNGPLKSKNVYMLW